tara:strand:+ start:326 stop:1825 length:1500 start_codon:yes stop_codon:yes gene_type:complete
MLGLASGTTKTRDNHTYSSDIAFKFDGTNDYITIPDHANFNTQQHATSYSRFTVSLWFQHATGSGTLSDTEVLCGRWDLNDKREWFIYLETDRYIKVGVSDDGTSGANIKTGTSTFQVSDTDWHHLYFCYDGSQADEERRALLIIDGTTVLNLSVGTPSGSNFALLNEANQDFYIGATHNNGTKERQFTGNIDEVCYWKGMFYKYSKADAAKYIYNNGKPRDMRYAGVGDARGSAVFVGYWKMGEFYTFGCPVPASTYANASTNPHDSAIYKGSTAYPLVALNYAGGVPVRTGSNLIDNGSFEDGGPSLSDSQTSNTANGWISTATEAGAVVSTDTAFYKHGTQSAKVVTDEDGGFVSIKRDSNAALEDGEFYVLEFWWRSSTDISDSGSEEWARIQLEVDECIEADAQYGLSGDYMLATVYSKINQWHRARVVGKYNAGSNNAEEIKFGRQFGNLDDGEGPQTFWIDNISFYKITGSHHGLLIGDLDTRYQEYVDGEV